MFPPLKLVSFGISQCVSNGPKENFLVYALTLYVLRLELYLKVSLNISFEISRIVFLRIFTYRQVSLQQSEEFQQLLADINEQESWVAEKMVLVSSTDYGDTLAAVQGLLKKHSAFQTDFKVHQHRSEEITKQGNDLIERVGLYFQMYFYLAVKSGRYFLYVKI